MFLALLTFTDAIYVQLIHERSPMKMISVFYFSVTANININITK